MKDFQSSRFYLRPVLQCHSLCHLLFRIRREHAGDLRIILLVDMFSGGKKAMREISIICQKQKSLRVDVESTDRKQISAILPAQQVNSLVSAIFRRRNDSLRFIEHIILICVIQNLLSVKCDLVAIRINFAVRLLLCLSVDLNSSFFSCFSNLTATSLVHICQKFIQPNRFCHIFPSPFLSCDCPVPVAIELYTAFKCVSFPLLPTPSRIILVL